MKLVEIIAAMPALYKLSNPEINPNIPLTVSYDVFTLTESLQSDIKFFDERNLKIIEKYEGKIKDDGTIEYPKEKREEAQKEFNETLLFDVKGDIARIKIPLIDKINLSAAEIRTLLPLVDFIKGI